MITTTVIRFDYFDKLEVQKNKAAYRNFGHAAASIRKDVVGTIEQTDGPSAPGEPPHTHYRKFLARAIRFAYDADSAVIGPTAEILDDAGQRLEFGEGMEPRPFMGPGLDRAIPRLGDNWQGSLGT